MKKLVTVLLAVVLVFSLASVAMAAQLTTNKTLEFEDGKYSYMPTTWDVYGTANDKLTGIYLPNQDNPEQYRIHSNYAKNTDACAACHATHTAVGAALLQWGNVYEACFACHDGTVSTTYNVKGGEIGDSTDRTFGGMFGPTAGETSASNHGVSGGIDISAAPGGTDTANANEVDPTKGNAAAAWNVEFGCQSCHNPHGAGANARILNANPNGQMWEKFNSGDTKDVTLVDAGVTKTQGATTYDGYKVNNTTFILKGYPYSSVTAVYDDGAPITTAIIDNTNTVYSVVYIPNTLSGTFTINYVPALKVKMNITDYLGDAEDVTHVSGLNDYCGACHTDYNTADDMAGFVDGAYDGSGSHLTGEYSEAYRHQVGMDVASFTGALTGLKMPREGDTMTCETCHFAHGTNKDLWNEVQDTNGNIADDEWVDEISGSSALKRLPNMATCEACHQKGQGNEGYGDAYAGAGATAAVSSSSALVYKYVGSDKCVSCHKTFYDGWKASMHNKKLRAGVKDENNNWIMLDQARENWNRNKAAVKAAAVAAGYMTAGDPLDDGTTHGPGSVEAKFPHLIATDANTDGIADDSWFTANIRYTVGAGYKKQIYVMKDSVTNAFDDVYSMPQPNHMPGVNMATDPTFATGKTNYSPFMWVTAMNKGYGGWVWKPFSFTWETNCIGCHVTGVSKVVTASKTPGDMSLASWADGNTDARTIRLNGAAKAGTTEAETANFVFNEEAVGCEACHGPGYLHTQSPTTVNIKNPSKFESKAMATEACGACHSNSNGKKLASNGMNSWDYMGNEFLTSTYAGVAYVTYSYVPGDSFGKLRGTTAPTGYSDGRPYFTVSNTWTTGIGANNKKMLYAFKVSAGTQGYIPGNEAGYIDDFQPRSEYDQFQLADADMKEAVSCYDCHDMHVASEGSYADRRFGGALKRPASQLCSQCHATGLLYNNKVTGENMTWDEQNVTLANQINYVMSWDAQCDSRSYGPRHTFLVQSNGTTHTQRKIGTLLSTGDESGVLASPQYSGGAAGRSIILKIEKQLEP